jgi:hypothetical protein
MAPIYPAVFDGSRTFEPRQIYSTVTTVVVRTPSVLVHKA